MTPTVTETLRGRLWSPADPAALAAFRVLFGAVMAFATVRFWLNGWIDSIYLEPDFHFTYAWFPWVAPLPSAWLHFVFLLMGISAAFITLGAWTRRSAAVFFVLFTYTELIEKAAYLNHYYLVSILGLLLVFIPTDRVWAVTPAPAKPEGPVVPLGVYWFLRTQVGLVYFFAGFAKINGDWLLRAEPLRTWLQNSAHIPFFGPILATESTAFLMSWSGALFDLTIWAFLLWGRTRTVAFIVAVLFHVIVWTLFPIGVFPWVMILSITLFLSPSWPRDVAARLGLVYDALKTQQTTSEPLIAGGRLALVTCLIWLALQVAIPLRFVAYPGDVNWTERGFRFSWRVMLIEKTGTLEYRIETQTPKRSYRVSPRERLTPLQFKMLTTQPDMIIQYARHLATGFRQRGHAGVAVYADSYISFNGRMSQPYIDGRANLADEQLRESDVILPLNAVE